MNMCFPGASTVVGLPSHWVGRY